MPENSTIAATETQNPTPIVAKRGNTERIPFTLPQDNNTTHENTDIDLGKSQEVTEGANATQEANKGGAAHDTQNQATPPAPTLTYEQLTAYFKAQGIEYTGLDNLKAKLNPTNEPTQEQIEAKAKAQEKRRVDLFVNGGGTIDQYVALKNVAEADVKELSTNTLKTELKAAGFNEEEITSIIKERYYQISDEELEQYDEETDKQFAKRKKEYGDKLLSNRSLPIKTQAAGILADLNKAIESEDLHAKNELAISANIDEQFKTIARKDTYEIGEINRKPITPIESEVPESELAIVHNMFKDPAQRKQFLENQDGSLNYTNIVNVLVENAKLKAAVKTAFHESATRTNAHWEKTFGARSPQELGVGGSQSKPNGQTTGKPVSYGKPQRVQPQRQ